MSDPIAHLSPSVGALDARSHLLQLEEERRLAVEEGLAGIPSFMADLEAELDYRQRVYVVAAVTEIASLRGELFGPQLG